VTAEVNATTGSCVASGTSLSCGGSSGLVGYWNPGFGYTGNTTFTSKDFNYFPSGEYTIVAADDWGQTVYAQFQVISSASNAETVGIAITDSAFEPSQITLTVGHNNTLLFVDKATSPPLVKLASESPWPSGFAIVLRGLTYGENYTVTLNVPGVYYFTDAESVDQGNVTIDVIGGGAWTVEAA
jgi:plastocyanin